ncbi:hypothetical protein DL93DRAFT_604082 [Clavulina sp. PMI_390]|nr:hypothetical protein DL93DRAFT_604082 [Clavulina sp. PMI_390]
MFVDRSTHFLWASLILNVFFAKERRLVECMATVGATARFALACGLIRRQPSVKSTNHSYPDGYILPPPKDKAEAEERIRLAHVVYVGCQALPPLCGFAPAFTNDDRQSLILGGISLGYDDEKVPTTAEELWRFDLHIKLAILATFERVRIFAHSVTASGYHGHEEEYVALEMDVNAQLSSSLALFDNKGLQPQEASNTFNPRIVLAHAALYGSGLILHSVRADDDANSKRKMFECVRALIEICDNGRKNKRHHVGLMNSSHMMNAVRVIARELRRSQAKENAGLSIHMD